MRPTAYAIGMYVSYGKRIKAIVVAVLMLIASAVFGLGLGGSAAASEYVYTGAIEHIFTHELVYDTERAFAADNSLRNCFDKDHLTAREFERLLLSLHSNGYALISLDAALGGEPIIMPSGKKPIVMSFDDMTYDTVGRGCIDRIVLDGGKVCDYTARAEKQKTRERENVSILERFIEEHPDFSVNGGRATVCVNGYNGILGYRITPSSKVSDNVMARDTEGCKAVVAELKRLGYTFASHTYYHKYFNSMSYAEVEKDCAMWDEYIKPIVGDTSVLCFPAGEHNAKSGKLEVFRKHGFDTFLCVGAGATKFEREMTGVNFVYRKPFDGTALRLYKEQYAHLVDCEEIYDLARFRPYSYKGGYY